jgi:hypothetical protein
MTHVADMVVQQALFLALASDAEIDPDAAIKQLEALAFTASRLPDNQKALLRKRIRARAARASEEERKVLDEMEENLGL